MNPCLVKLILVLRGEKVSSVGQMPTFAGNLLSQLSYLLTSTRA